MSERLDVDLSRAVTDSARLLRRASDLAPEHPGLTEIGAVTAVGRGVVEIEGLPGLQSEELVRIGDGHLAMALNLDPGRAGAILLDRGSVEAGQDARRTGTVMDVPVGESLLGRIVDPMGRVLDGGRPLRLGERWPIERTAPGMFERRPVESPLQTGIKVIDSLIPIGRGQRELIVGDRQTGKTTVALDTIAAQKDTGVVCVYCTIGERSSSLAKAIASLRSSGALDHTFVVATTGEDAPGLQFVAPYAATTMAEWFMEQGRDVVIVYDDLTRHARTYRELSLLLRRPPGREAYPGDIFYVHSRLLERATRLSEPRGGGSLTALPIIETRAQNISAYIPTNLISITDGQVYLSPRLFHQGVLPAIDVGRSVSRVGGRAQLRGYRQVAGSLRLTYAQFEELERFTRYGAKLEGTRRRTLARGQRIREILRQGPLSPVPPGEQVALLVAVTEGAFDNVPLEAMSDVETRFRNRVRIEAADLVRDIESGGRLGDDQVNTLLELSSAVAATGTSDGHA